jgi:tetratricopeptide (TPR) repeat protein
MFFRPDLSTSGSRVEKRTMTDEYSTLTPEFRERLKAARQAAGDARAAGDKAKLADALKYLSGIERRPPFLRDAANATLAEAAELYRELDMPLDAAWAIRHIGINHEYAENLVEAEKYYDECLAIFRGYATENSLDYANAVRYPAVIKNRLGNRQDSAKLWEEACGRYEQVKIWAGVAEAAGWLTIFAIEAGDREIARRWCTKAEDAAARAGDADTDRFVADVREQLGEPAPAHLDKH